MDPHISQSATNKEQIHYNRNSFMCRVVKGLKLSKVDVSMGIGFVIRSKSDLDDLQLKL